jgi:hypothetical protein
MPWQQRIKEAAYTSPSGERQVFQYENVRKQIDKKTSSFDFPDANGTLIQDLGHSGRRYPLQVIFWGDDYDTVSNDFEKMLLEKGVGRLEHPVYGTINVVPFGRIVRRDDLKTAANQAIFNVTFYETIGEFFPKEQEDQRSSILKALDDFKESISEEFKDLLGITSSVEETNFQVRYQRILDDTTNSLSNIAKVQDDINSEFNAIVDSINNGIDILIEDPLTLAFQTVQMIQSPARAVGSIIARLNAYADLANDIIFGDDAVKTKGLDSNNANEFHVNDLFVSTYITGAIVAVINHEYITKTDALLDAERIVNKFQEVKDWRDDNFESLEKIDTGASYQQLQKAVSLTAGFLVELSFDLQQEKSIVLDRNRTIIDLCGELYGEIDERLDFMINSNTMNGDSIIELERGQEIVYFV